MAFEDRGLDIVPFLEALAEIGPLAAGQHLRAFALPNLDVREDLLELIRGGLGADHRIGIEWVALDHLPDPLNGTLDKRVVNGLLHQRSARAGAHFALIEGEHREAFERLVEEVIIFVVHVGKEDVGRLAAQFECDRDYVLGGILHDEPPCRRLTRERDLGDARIGGERFAGLDAETVDDVEHARWQQVADDVHQHHDAHWRLLGRFQDDAIAGCKRRRQLPHRHQDGEVPWDDLTDDTERLMKVIRDRRFVDFGKRAFLCTDASGEVAEVVDGQWQVCCHRFANGFSVVDRLHGGDLGEVRLDAVGDLVENSCALGGRCFAPGILRSVRGIKCRLDVFGG